MAKLNDSTIILNTQPSNFYGNSHLDASIAGNGHIGISLTGAFSNERILINHACLKSGGYTGVLQDVSDKFPQVRKLYTDGKIFDAEKLLATEFKKKNCNPQPDMHMPLCALELNFIGQGQISDYKRITNMESGEILVEYNASGTTIERGCFVGRTTDIIAYNVYKSGNQKINMNISVSAIYDSGFAFKTPKEQAQITSTRVAKYEGGYVYFAGREKTNDYGLVARIVMSGGTAQHTENGVVIKDADELTIFAKPFVTGNRDAQFKSLKGELQGIKHTYSKLQSQNEAVHKRLFSACDLTIKPQTNEVLDMATLIERASTGTLSEALIVRSWNFAKYLAICTGSALTPGGLWVTKPNDQNAVLKFDNSAQLLYSGLVNSVNPDALLELFEFYDKYAADLKKNSARVYGAKGYFVPNTTSPDSALFGGVDASDLHFIASSALAANLFYNYFLATADTKTLKSKILPFMKEVFNFYSDFLKLDNNGFYSTLPSYSPRSTPGNTIQGKPLQDFALTTNSTIDFLAFGALLDNLIHASEILGQKGDEVVWQEMKKKLPQFSVNEHGAIKEYTNSAFVDGIVNRGNMHCYGLYPLKTFAFGNEQVQYKPAVATANGTSITLKQASSNACVARLKNAGHVQDAQTLAMYAAQLANADNANATRETLLKLLSSCFTNSGLCLTNDWRGSGYTNANSPSLDISGNIGFAQTITECLVQSDRKHLKIMPVALTELGVGELDGIVTDFSATVTMNWDIKNHRVQVKLLPKLTTKIDIYINPQFKKLKNKDLVIGNDGWIRGVQLTANKAFTIDVG